MKSGIVGYGAYIPKYRLKIEELAKAKNQSSEKINATLNVYEKAVASPDEDSITMATQAANTALNCAEISAHEIGAIYFASESHPYAVKPSSSILGSALGCGNNYMAADMEFACKGGTASLQVCAAQVKSEFTNYALAIGSDTAQAKPGDILEYTASAAAGAIITGNNESQFLASIDATLSFTTDTPDFWRREYQKYPKHTGRFTGEPSYFFHLTNATKKLLDQTGLEPSQIDHVVFHQPNGKFPIMAAKKLGFTEEQIKAGLVSPQIGNSYSACTLIGLCAVLDIAKPNQKILIVSYGSGSGSDAFLLSTTNLLTQKRKQITPVLEMIDNKQYISYIQYKNHIEKLIKG